MSLPPGFLDELRTRVSLTDVVGRKVMWDTRKSNQGKGDMWSPCPFHQEKTASFHVDDRKGFYYCFGCHAKGDAISFVKDTENVSFIEAIEILAGEAGMTMPARDPRAQEKSDARAELTDVMEQAVRFFRMSLGTGAGASSRAYLQKRGLAQSVLDRFEIGYAPDDRQALFRALTEQGVPKEKLIATGLCALPDDGGAPYDRFRGRIIFPIRDGRGRCIAFGGRSLAPNARAKYLNSPETILFDKGRNLYNHGPARAASGKGKPLIVAEGYMDVIALVEAGFEASVAPLGTAVTEDQLMLMWRMNPEPIIALDGDKAGLRAAYRLIDLALPLLEAGRALRFAIMPEGKDPDDLLRAGGPKAVQDVLDTAVPMVELLWRRETEGGSFDSPERKAALDKTLGQKIGLIRDPVLKSHYEQTLKDLKWSLFRPKRTLFQPYKKQAAQTQMTTKHSALAASGDHVADTIREGVIVAVFLNTPAMLDELGDQLFGLTLSDPDLNRVLSFMRSSTERDTENLRQEIEEVIGAAPLEKLMASAHVRITPCLRVPHDLEMARMTVAEELAKLGSERGLRSELEEAEQVMDVHVDETVLWRLGQAATARNNAAKSDNEDRAQYDLGDNGARINRDEKQDFEKLLSKISYAKTQKR